MNLIESFLEKTACKNPILQYSSKDVSLKKEEVRFVECYIRDSNGNVVNWMLACQFRDLVLKTYADNLKLYGWTNDDLVELKLSDWTWPTYASAEKDILLRYNDVQNRCEFRSPHGLKEYFDNIKIPP